jgi:hypothetical protein
MKNFFILLFAGLFIIISGCKKDDSGTNPTGTLGGGGIGGGGGGDNTGNVTFTTAIVQDDQNQLWFEFKPSTGVIIQRITAKCQALGIDDAIEDVNIPDDVFNNTSPLYIGPITVTLQQGQQWTFTISGKIGSIQGQSFSTTFNYTVQ